MVHHKYGEEYYNIYGEEYAPKMRIALEIRR